jgi:hypothetical protein
VRFSSTWGSGPHPIKPEQISAAAMLAPLGKRGIYNVSFIRPSVI